MLGDKILRVSSWPGMDAFVRKKQCVTLEHDGDDELVVEDVTICDINEKLEKILYYYLPDTLCIYNKLHVNFELKTCQTLHTAVTGHGRVRFWKSYYRTRTH